MTVAVANGWLCPRYFPSTLPVTWHAKNVTPQVQYTEEKLIKGPPQTSETEGKICVVHVFMCRDECTV